MTASPFFTGGVTGIGGVKSPSLNLIQETISESIDHSLSTTTSGIYNNVLSQPFAFNEFIGTAFIEAINQALSLQDGLGTGWFEPLTDSFTLADTIFEARGFFRVSAEAIELSTTDALQRLGFPALTELITLSPSIIGTIATIVADQLTLSDTITTEEILRLLEGLGFTVSLSSTATQHVAIADSVTLNDLLLVIYELLIGENLEFTLGETSFAQRYNAVSEALQQADSTVSKLIAQEIISTALLFNDDAFRFFEQQLTDSVGSADVITSALIALNTLTEQVDTTETLSESVIITTPVGDTLSLADALQQNATQNAALEELVNVFTVQLKIAGEQYTGWVLNTETAAPTQYQNFNFNSLTKFDETYLGASDSGIYKLVGSDDAGTAISAVLKSGVSQLGSGQKKRVDRAYLGFRADGNLVLKTITDEQTERWYELTQVKTGLHPARIKLGKGVKSRFWQFEIVNKDGADFEFESIELIPLALSRRL